MSPEHVHTAVSQKMNPLNGSHISIASGRDQTTGLQKAHQV